ncbi:MAG: SDR family NAD(P)-dependent oxidoreductase [SAR202 cluster bacterium]|nr:SDR family NAD(P)-dependent oxidoreductase [SAR202 cluster bacterium]MDP6300125.1 SDR family NAD(P)-dependent oxidoreductase [SAR202 cluster bacterium]MDP7102930.1 SDR family NAD(P)-dependent oxidoreductase [SAR202 cluster bacterium]MDP7225762.1 SDR family NAD(P)-dependent oxidoreductase [SAR202 cluster bacterium]MDP7414358.1 SDR family NAD(P)-dependent oxidoreductase [SAR202 cluster bacterium]
MRVFKGKVAVVTGAASGIGLAMASRFAHEGMKVVLADVEDDALDAAVSDLKESEYDVMGVVTDVSDADSIRNLARTTLEAYGGVHILCNNAGVTAGAYPLWEASINDWE